MPFAGVVDSPKFCEAAATKDRLLRARKPAESTPIAMEIHDAKLWSRLDQSRIECLTTTLAMCFTFADVATTEIGLSDREGAKQAVAYAERGYETLSRFLSDPKHISHLSADNIRQFTAELERLRERLDGLDDSIRLWS